MGLFDSFTQSLEPVVSQAASLLEDVTSQFKSGALSKSEYDELTADILDYSKISANITDMIRQQEIYDAFQQLLSIVSLVKSI